MHRVAPSKTMPAHTKTIDARTMAKYCFSIFLVSYCTGEYLIQLTNTHTASYMQVTSFYKATDAPIQIPPQCICQQHSLASTTQPSSKAFLKSTISTHTKPTINTFTNPTIFTPPKATNSTLKTPTKPTPTTEPINDLFPEMHSFLSTEEYNCTPSADEYNCTPSALRKKKYYTIFITAQYSTAWSPYCTVTGNISIWTLLRMQKTQFYLILVNRLRTATGKTGQFDEPRSG